jgi:ComF family protein
MSLLEDLRSLARQLCPESCPRCNMRSPPGFCRACRRDFARIDAPCLSCGLAALNHRCPAVEAGWAIDAVRAPFIYTAPLAAYLQALKYARQRTIGRALGALLLSELKATMPSCDAILAVPLHSRRLRLRSFNQADEIARPIGRALDRRLLVSGIRRCRHTPPQTTLDRRDRLRSLERAFSVRRNLTGLSLAVVDDVITTGATVNALATELKAAGAERVEAWAVARAIGPEAGSR